jgi:uncharacterized protein YjbI with pentapeptide repeats
VANLEHLKLLQQGVAAWNAWRAEKPHIRPDLDGANLRKVNLGAVLLTLREASLSGEVNLSRTDLREADLQWANLSGANLEEANLSRVNLCEANLSKANLSAASLEEANLSRVNLSWANLSGANLLRANLSWANLRGAVLLSADLSRAGLREANLRWANLSGASLGEANLQWANLRGASLGEANLSRANLDGAALVETNLVSAILTGCRVYGISAWNVKVDKGTKQQDLVITRQNEPTVVVDNIEVAQFVYLLVHNEKIRDVIDTVTSRVVLILGRFTPERKAVLEAIREELRNRHYVPILFDFDVPATRDITETVSLLAHMSRFIIADLTDPSSIPKELEAIIPHLAIPVQPLLEGDRPYAMFKDYWKYDWVLPTHQYDGLEALLGTLADKVIAPAEGKMNDLADKRRRFEAELVKPR